jgi:hypothetical protein
VNERQVSRREAVELAKKRSMVYFETSAKTNTKIHEVFKILALKVMVACYPKQQATKEDSICSLQ